MDCALVFVSFIYNWFYDINYDISFYSDNILIVCFKHTNKFITGVMTDDFVRECTGFSGLYSINQFMTSRSHLLEFVNNEEDESDTEEFDYDFSDQEDLFDSD